ncbi:AAA family ATPase [Dermatobacter hominis]|uniref:AAA family ATPase n=1 Tax=Dermatobacter hominis TaxID=2884263 RepID=UPI001D0FAE76|nr:AAA family ATPase [Dermatobacter hominis]UDY35735.1 AAA family ATPase [Dermatobacter hominis]
MGAGPLDVVVTSFVDDVGMALEEATSGLQGIDRGRFTDDVTVEAFNLTTAMIDADDRHTDEELNALIDAFGPRLEDSQLIRATPDTLRGSTLVAGHRRWLDVDSELFGLLVDADRRNGTRLADAYYERALDIAHVVASLDVIPARAELEAISALRARLLEGLRSRDPDRPLHATPPDSALGPGARAVAGGGPAEGGEAERPPDPPPRPLEELLAELDDLVGLDEVKARVRLVADFLRVQQLRAERELPTVDTSHHLVFTGNPGTGKTTVARLLAQIYRTLGVVARGHLVETDRSGLVAGYVGQTAPLVTKRFDEADEGMLFIDEAYTLARGGENDFGREAIDQIVKLMEDRRDRVVLVVAGYTGEMEHLLSSNPGLRSRFPTVIQFPDYTTDELVRIVDSIGDKQRYRLTDAARGKLRAVLDATPRGQGFGNARLARNLFESAINHHASRVMRLEGPPTEEDLTTLLPDDLPDRASPDDAGAVPS